MADKCEITLFLTIDSVAAYERFSTWPADAAYTTGMAQTQMDYHKANADAADIVITDVTAKIVDPDTKAEKSDFKASLPADIKAGAVTKDGKG